MLGSFRLACIIIQEFSCLQTVLSWILQDYRANPSSRWAQRPTDGSAVTRCSGWAARSFSVWQSLNDKDPLGLENFFTIKWSTRNSLNSFSERFKEQYPEIMVNTVQGVIAKLHFKNNATPLYQREMKGEGAIDLEPRGWTRSIHDGGSDGASYCEPQKIH